MMSREFASFVMFCIGAGTVIGGYLVAMRLPGRLAQRRLESRLDEISRGHDEQQDGSDSGLLKEQHEGYFDRLASKSRRGSALTRWVEQSGAKVSMNFLLLSALGLAFLVGFIVAAVLRMPVGWMLGGAVGAAIPFLVLSRKRKKRLRTFEENFPEALDLMARALKAGHAFATGLKMVADEMPEPIGPEFRKTFDEQNYGLPLKDALGSLSERIPILDVRFFSTAVLIQRETGGNLAEILENLGHVVRERFKILRQVRVHTAHGRLTGYVLLALPAFLAVALSIINPEHMQLLFRERMGHIMIGAAVIMQAIGYFWIKQVVKIEV